MNNEWQTESIMKHEKMILENQIILKDFMARYDIDRQSCSERYRQDREEARQWRKEMDEKISDINRFLTELKPNYRAFLAFVGLTVLSAFALIFKMIWTGIHH